MTQDRYCPIGGRNEKCGNCSWSREPLNENFMPDIIACQNEKSDHFQHVLTTDHIGCEKHEMEN